MPAQVSQKRIAEAAGVSQATVSLVLSGQAVASQATRDRVLRAAETLKYRPNLLVRGMQTGRTKTIGVMVPPYDYHWSEVLYGIHDRLGEADHVPITLWSARDHGEPWHRVPPQENVLEQVHRLLDRRIDGVILWPPTAAVYQEHVQEFLSRDLPVVTIDHQLSSRFKADCVMSDERQGTAVVLEHLLGLGHRRLGHMAGIPNATWAITRRQLFERAVAQAGVGVTLVTCAPVENETSSMIEAATALLTGPDRPTAIFASSDWHAKAIYRACRDLNLSVPEDLSVVGFSDDGFAEEMVPPLTTVRQSAYEMGRAAAELVLDRCNAEPDTNGSASTLSTCRVLPVSLVVRHSTAAPPRR